MTVIRSLAASALAVVFTLLIPAPASGQITRLGSTFGVWSASVRGSDIAFDSKNKVYLAVSTMGVLRGRFISEDGVPLGDAFVIQSSGAGSHFPRVAFSPDAAAGAGAFLVTWHASVTSGGTHVYSRLVSYTQGLGTESVLAESDSFWEAGPAVAYATGSKEFLVVWQGYGSYVRYRRVGINGVPLAAARTIDIPGDGERDPNVAYNSVTDEFFVIYSGWDAHSATVKGQRVKAGVDQPPAEARLLGRAAATYITDVSYDPISNQYLAAWYSSSWLIEGILVASNGDPIGSVRPLSATFKSYDALRVAFNTTSGTHFLISQGPGAEDGGVQVSGGGIPLDSGTEITAIGGRLGNFYPRVAAHSSRADWTMTASHEFAVTIAQRFGTNTTAPPPPPPPPPTPTPSPTPTPPPGRPVSDFNADGRHDIAIWRPSTGTWHIRNQFSAQWGTLDDVPVPGDYNGDGTTDIAIWRPATGTWHIRNQFSAQWGTVGDVPVPGDYNGDGITDIAIWRPATGTWHIRNQFSAQWGTAGDVPVPGDYNGDGKTDIAVWRPSQGVWYVLNQFWVQWGAAGDVPVPRDYNGDGKTDVAVWRPSQGVWYVLNQFWVQWGAAGDVPVPGDYNGDGRADVAVWRPSHGVWYVLNQFWAQWGTAGDVPIGSR